MAARYHYATLCLLLQLALVAASDSPFEDEAMKILRECDKMFLPEPPKKLDLYVMTQLHQCYIVSGGQLTHSQKQLKQAKEKHEKLQKEFDDYKIEKFGVEDALQRRLTQLKHSAEVCKMDESDMSDQLKEEFEEMKVERQAAKDIASELFTTFQNIASGSKEPINLDTLVKPIVNSARGDTGDIEGPPATEEAADTTGNTAIRQLENDLKTCNDELLEIRANRLIVIREKKKCEKDQKHVAQELFDLQQEAGPCVGQRKECLLQLEATNKLNDEYKTLVKQLSPDETLAQNMKELKHEAMLASLDMEVYQLGFWLCFSILMGLLFSCCCRKCCCGKSKQEEDKKEKKKTK